MDTVVATPPSRPLPGPRGYPLVGALPALRRDPLGFLLRVTQDYGPVVQLGSLGARKVVLVTAPEDIKYILLTHGRNYGRVRREGTVELLGAENMALYEGPRWQARRRILSPLFKPRSVTDAVPLMSRAVQGLLARWTEVEARGESLDVAREMKRLTLDIIAKVMFSTDIVLGDAHLGRAVEEVLDWVARRLWSPLGLPVSIPTPANRRFLAARRSLLGLIGRIVDERLQRDVDSGDMLSRLTQARDDDTGERLTRQEICDEVVSFFIAGHETTASALAWVWYALAQHDNVAQQVRDEIRAVAGDRPVQGDDLDKLTYTRQVIGESLRLYPPGWLIGRQSVQADAIGGFDVPARSVVMLSPYVTHRDPALWHDPGRFQPERFTPEAVAGRPRFAYLPFGGGPLSCIAAGFAMTEMTLVVARIMQSFRLALAPGHQVTPSAVFTLRPAGGLPMTLARGGF